jgi:CheY-specific phosphatase CheX
MSIKIESFITAIKKTFKNMGEIELINEKIDEFNSTEFVSDFTCSIGIIDKTERYSLILSIGNTTLNQIVYSITKNKTPHNHLVYDTMGEMLNIIVGIAQRENNSKFNFSLPVSIIGKDHLVHLVNDKRAKRCIFQIGSGEINFYLSHVQILNT